MAAFNLTFRVDREFVTEWDESLYAISAWEMAEKGEWIGVTTFGALDYVNAKPPLNVWLLVLAFKALGRGIVALRVPSILSAWFTVLALMLWARSCLGPGVSLTAGTVLATTFGFFQIHSGRTANTDPLFTLLVLLVVITLSVEEHRPWRRLWLGPLLASTFLLRGMAVLMPLVSIAIVDLLRRRGYRERLLPSAGAIAISLLPVGAWVWARYRLDGWMFFDRMIVHDFLARSTQSLDGHTGGLFYYPNILAKHHYDWLAVALIAVVLCPALAINARSSVAFWRGDRALPIVMTAWATSTLLIPTFMATKLPWYLNTFYPLFALGVATLLVAAFRHLAASADRRRSYLALTILVVVAGAVAEGKLLAYSYHYRDLQRSAQALLLEERDRFAGHRVFRDRLDRAATFVAGLVDVRLEVATTTADFLRESRPGDFFLASSPHDGGRHSMDLVRSMGEHSLFVRRERREPSDPRRFRDR